MNLCEDIFCRTSLNPKYLWGSWEDNVHKMGRGGQCLTLDWVIARRSKSIYTSLIFGATNAGIILDRNFLGCFLCQTSISKGSFNNFVIYEVFWSTCNSDYILSSAQNVKMVLRRYFQSSHFRKLDFTDSPGKIYCRFTTQQSRHKSATATMSWNSKESIYSMLTGVT